MRREDEHSSDLFSHINPGVLLKKYLSVTFCRLVCCSPLCKYGLISLQIPTVLVIFDKMAIFLVLHCSYIVLNDKSEIVCHVGKRKHGKMFISMYFFSQSEHFLSL